MIKRSYARNERSKCCSLYPLVGRAHIHRHFSRNVVEVKYFVDACEVYNCIEHCARGVLMILMVADVLCSIGVGDIYPDGTRITPLMIDQCPYGGYKIFPVLVYG